MDTPEDKKQIRDKILSAIHSGNIAMRPRWHFVLRATLIAIGGIIIFLVVLYLTSFILFMLRASGVSSVPLFGPRGWQVFFVSLPWLLILTLVVFVVILEILVRRFAFAYRRPLLYSVLLIAVLMMVGGFIVDQTRFQNRLFRYARDHHVFFAGDFYRNFGTPQFHEIHGGEIIGITQGGFTVRTPRGEMLNIVVASSTRFPLGINLVEGDSVVVFGERTDDTVQALGVAKVDPLDPDDSALPFPMPTHQPLFPGFFNAH